jgi:hypothetical protein
MAELPYIYQRSFGEKEDFLNRIIPLSLADARFGTWRDRLVYTKYWRAEFEEMQLNFKGLGEMDFRLYKSMQEWHNRIGDMLAYLNDVLAPHRFDNIVKDDFAALRLMLHYSDGADALVGKKHSRLFPPARVYGAWKVHSLTNQ